MFVNPVLYGQYSAFFLGEDGKTLYPYEQHVSWGIYARLNSRFAVVIIMVVVLSREKKFTAGQLQRHLPQRNVVATMHRESH